eukprot:s7543_g4.t1
MATQLATELNIPAGDWLAMDGYKKAGSPQPRRQYQLGKAPLQGGSRFQEAAAPKQSSGLDAQTQELDKCMAKLVIKREQDLMRMRPDLGFVIFAYTVLGQEQKQKELEEMAPVVLFAADTTVQDSGPQWRLRQLAVLEVRPGRAPRKKAEHDARTAQAAIDDLKRRTALRDWCICNAIVVGIEVVRHHGRHGSWAVGRPAVEWFQGEGDYAQVVEKILRNLEKGYSCDKELFLAQSMKSMMKFWEQTNLHPQPFASVLARPQVKKMPRPVAKPSPKVQASMAKGVKPSQAPGLSGSSSSEPSPWEIVDEQIVVLDQIVELDDNDQEEQQSVHPDHDMHTRLVLTPGCQSLCRVCLSLSVRTKSVTESAFIN